jgi:hypothetical protein
MRRDSTSTCTRPTGCAFGSWRLPVQLGVAHERLADQKKECQWEQAVWIVCRRQILELCQQDQIEQLVIPPKIGRAFHTSKKLFRLAVK